ncbi:MAG TPA: hypothetical protein VK116_14855, partial [Planctomycetota bacterium]|nr:hypothetical protein [Planctomycetota bacterium]
EQLLRVRVAVQFFQLTPHLYIGSRHGSVHREIFRLPIPEGAQILENSGPMPGLQWKTSSDGRWFVIDEPVPGFADQAHILRERRSWRWSVSYAIPAKQLQAFTFRFPTQVGSAVLFANKAHGAMNLVSTGMLDRPRPIDRDPLTGDTGVAYDAYAVSKNAGTPGSELVFALEIDNAALEQVSHRAIKWHGGFMIIALVGILLGLILGARRPKERASLIGLGPDELLDRLVALDRRFEEGRIRERDYKAYREALVEMIAAELPEEQGGVTASANGKSKALPAPNASALVPARAGAILAEIRAIEAKGDGDPALAAERSRLLEALAKSLEEVEGRR